MNSKNERTDKPISYSLKFHTSFKLFMSKDLTRDAVVSHVFMINRDFAFLADSNDARAETACELFGVLERNWFLRVEDDERVQTV